MFRKTVRLHVLKKKPSLSTLLQETIQKQWDEIKNTLRKFSYFDDWSEPAIHQCCVHSNILHYAANEIIFVKDDANVEVTHFVLEGTASVLQRLVLERYRRKIDGNWGYRLHNDQSAKVSSNHSKLKIIFMQICKLNEGACFGLGEKLAKKIIIAHTELKCLVVPKSIILRNKTSYNVWERIIITLDLNTPSLQQVYKEYMNARRKLAWATDVYKCGQYGVYNRIPVNVTIHDVPLTIRSSSIQYANKCKAAMKDPMYLVGEKKTKKNDRRLNIGLA